MSDLPADRHQEYVDGGFTIPEVLRGPVPRTLFGDRLPWPLILIAAAIVFTAALWLVDTGSKPAVLMGVAAAVSACGLIIRSWRRTRWLAANGTVVKGLVTLVSEATYLQKKRSLATVTKYKVRVYYEFQGSVYDAWAGEFDRRHAEGSFLALLVDPREPKAFVAYESCGFKVVGTPTS